MITGSPSAGRMNERLEVWKGPRIWSGPWVSRTSQMPEVFHLGGLLKLLEVERRREEGCVGEGRQAQLLLDLKK